MLGETMSDMVEPFLLLTSSSSSSDGSSNSWNDDGDEEEKEMVEGGDNNINNNDENDGNVMNELNNKQHQKKMKKKIVTKKNVSNNKKDEEDKTDNIPLKPRRRITPTTTKHYPLSSSSTSVQVSSRPSTTTVNQSQQLARPFQQPSHPYNHEDLLLQSALGRGLRHASSSFGHALCSTIGNPISQLRTSFDDRFIRKIIPLLELYTEQKRAYLKLSSGRGREGENERALRRAMRPVWMRTSMQLRSEADVMACLTMGRLDKWVRGVIIQQERGLAVAMVNMKEAFERARVMTSGSSGGDEDEMMKMELMQNDSSRTEKQKKKKKKEDGQQHVLMTSTTSGAAAGPRQLGM